MEQIKHIWKCNCDYKNNANYCSNCGAPRQVQAMDTSSIQQRYDALRKKAAGQLVSDVSQPIPFKQPIPIDNDAYHAGVKQLFGSIWLLLLAMACSITAVLYLLYAINADRIETGLVGLVIYIVLSIAFWRIWVVGRKKESKIPLKALKTIKVIMLIIIIIIAFFFAFLLIFGILYSGSSIVAIIMTVVSLFGFLFLFLYFIPIVNMVNDVCARWKRTTLQKSFKSTIFILFAVAAIVTIRAISIRAYEPPKSLSDSHLWDFFDTEKQEQMLGMNRTILSFNALMHMIGGILAMKYHRLVQETIS